MDHELTQAVAAFQRCIEHRDRAASEEVLDEDYALVLVVPACAVVPRERWLQMLDGYVVHAYAVEEQAVDVNGDLAAVLHRVRMTATVLGEDRSGLFVLSDVWRRRNGRWRVWRRHSTPLSAGTLPGLRA